MNKEKEARIIAQDQINFCGELMDRIHQDYMRDMRKTPEFSWQVVANTTQLVGDIKRLRRELMKLAKVLRGEIL